jgi:hypothetical protein
MLFRYETSIIQIKIENGFLNSKLTFYCIAACACQSNWRGHGENTASKRGSKLF